MPGPQQAHSRRACQHCGRTNASKWIPCRKENGYLIHWHPDLRDGECRRCRGEHPFTPEQTAERALRWIDEHEEALRALDSPHSARALRKQARSVSDPVGARELRADLEFLAGALADASRTTSL